MRHVLIDGQKAVEIHPYRNTSSEDGETTFTLSFSEAYEVLSEWVKLAPGRRGFRYATEEDDDDPSKIFVAEAVHSTLGGATLLLEEIEPYWTGEITLNLYALEAIAAALGDGVLQWGADIGEEDL